MWRSPRRVIYKWVSKVGSRFVIVLLLVIGVSEENFDRD
jgi:hypothetical protein